MSETKFTPGPWFVDADFYVYGGDGGKIKGEYFDGVEFPLVCDAESDSRDRTENKANAALIAAAPELYRELEKHCALCMMMHPECEKCELCETRKVLKKVRGEE